jgi:hypothetical protein
MIKTVTSSGQHLFVQGGTPITNYFNTSPGYLNVGEIRFNPNAQSIEVYDGQVWRELQQGHVQVGMTPAAEAAINWAEKKMARRTRTRRTCKTISYAGRCYA